MFLKKNKDWNYFSTIVTLSMIFMFIIYAVMLGSTFVDKLESLESKLFSHFYFLFFITVNIIVISLFVLAGSKHGKKKIGGEDAKVDYSSFAWYSMLFSAGMGIGIMFYGVVEPLSHYYYNPLFVSNDNAVSALATTYFSWGIHAWAIYALIGLAFAYFVYNKKLPLSLRSLFYPILKDKIYGKMGDVIDSIGAVVTLFALSSSLALGAMQINSGLHFLIGINVTVKVQIIIIILVIIAATISVVSGLDKGVRVLSEINIKMVAFLAICLLLIGPTLYIIKNLFLSTTLYVMKIVPASRNVNNIDLSWASTWPIFYIAWWISWSIFVGMFIAKISKGRTIRQFILSIILIPTALTIIWFGVIGSNAIFVDDSMQLSNIVNQDVSLSLFAMLDFLIQSNIIKTLLQLLSFVIIIFFFITSSDSGSLIVNSLVNKYNTSKWPKIFWSLIQGILAISIVVAGGLKGVELVQSLLIIISLPLTIFLIYTLVVLLKELLAEDKKDKKNNKNKSKANKRS